MNRLDALIATPPSSITRHSARAVMVALACSVLWAFFAQLEEVAVASGEIVPQEQIQAIQHLEGGIVEKINVTEGSRVKAGQALVQLNITGSVANREELIITRESLLLKKARIEAEAALEKTLTFSGDLAKYRESLIRSEQQIFAGRRQKIESSLALLGEQVQQKKLDVEQLEMEKTTIANNLVLLREKLKISNDLVRDKLTSKLDNLQLASEVKELEGRLSVINVAIPRSKAALAETEERYRNEQISFRNQALEELSRVELDIAKTTELLTRATDQVQRTTIKSPIDGIIKSLNTHTIGGVVKPGDTIMEIVPISKNLMVEARLDPKDIGFVKPGQKALVKVLTYDYARYGGLEGDVISVSADSHTDNTKQQTYFLVKIRTAKSYLGDKEGSLPITTGMQATADIHTGHKSVMEYLLKPIIKIHEEALRER